MKCLRLQSNMSLGITSFATAIIIFLITISVAFAQTTIQLNPGTTDVSNIISKRPKSATSVIPTQTLFNENRNVQKTDVRNVKTNVQTTHDKKTNNTKSFLNRARSILKERREANRIRNKKESSIERNVKLKNQRKDRIFRFLNNVKRKMYAATSRLEKLSTRIESRIVKLEKDGLDMAAARQLLKIARDNIKSSVENIKVAVENAQEILSTNTNASRDSFSNVISELTKAKKSLQNAYKSLVEVIRIMKTSIHDKQSDNQKINSRADSIRANETN